MRGRGLFGLLRSGRARGGAPAGLGAALLCALDRDYAGAEAHLQRLAREDSSRIDVYLALARIFRLRGDIGRAIRVHQNLLLRSDLAPEQRRLAQIGLADDLREGGYRAEACAAYEEALAQVPREAHALGALAALYAAERPERALELARRLHRATGAGDAGRREEAALELAIAARARAEGSAQEARRALRRALRADPASAEAFALRGELEVERGRSKRALAAWQRALALDPGRAPALFGRIRSALASLGRAQEYEPLLRARLRARPDDAESCLELARFLAERGQAEPAAALLRALVERDPAQAEGRAELGRVLAAAGRPEEACQAYGGLVALLARSGALRPAAGSAP